MLGQFARFGVGNRDRRGNPLGTMLILIGAPLGAMLIRMAVSRAREYAADAGGAEISGKPLALASALGKLQRGVADGSNDTGKSGALAYVYHEPLFRGSAKAVFNSSACGRADQAAASSCRKGRSFAVKIGVPLSNGTLVCLGHRLVKVRVWIPASS